MSKVLADAELQSIAKALGASDSGLSNSEIDDLLAACGLPNFGPDTKWRRLYASFSAAQSSARARKPIIDFVKEAMRPPRHIGNKHRFEALRESLNTVFAFAGMRVDNDGRLMAGGRAAAKTISEAESIARQLRETLEQRGLHPEVLKYCRAELVDGNYFHAIFEACKGVSERIRTLSSLALDGSQLIDAALGGSTPLLRVNNYSSNSELSEHRGFVNLLKGIVSMFRNPLAHEPRLHWAVTRQDAEDLMGLLSLIHRRLDQARQA